MLTPRQHFARSASKFALFLLLSTMLLGYYAALLTPTSPTSSPETPLPTPEQAWLQQNNIDQYIDDTAGLNLPNAIKYVILIERTDGSVEAHRIPASITESERRKLLALLPGDKIINGWPLVPRISTPPLLIRPQQTIIVVTGAPQEQVIAYSYPQPGAFPTAPPRRPRP